MAHPDPRFHGSEKGQRDHSGPNTEASDAGRQRKSQSLHGEPPMPTEQGTDRAAAKGSDAERAASGSAAPAKDDIANAPESGDKPQVMTGGQK